MLLGHTQKNTGRMLGGAHERKEDSEDVVEQSVAAIQRIERVRLKRPSGLQ